MGKKVGSGECPPWPLELLFTMETGVESKTLGSSVVVYLESLSHVCT